MGGKSSKNRRKNTENTQGDENDWKSSNREDQYVEYLQKELEENVEIFLLNHLLMSFQFFENYERDVTELRAQQNQTSNYEVQLNKSLLEYQKSCLLPDPIGDLVNKKVNFRQVHGPKKNVLETLVPLRIFVYHENIEIEKLFDQSEYSNAGGPIYRFVIKDIEKVVNENTKRKEVTGFVKLEKFELPRKNEEIPSTSKNLPSEVPKSPSSKISQYSPKRSPLTLRTQTQGSKAERTAKISPSPKIDGKFIYPEKRLSKTETDIEVEYEYGTITNLTTKRSLQEVRLGQKIYENFGTLPENCFYQWVKNPKEENEEDSDDEDDKKEKTFLKSKEFFQHFGDAFENIFPIFGFSESDKYRAQSQGGIIYIEKEEPLPNFGIEKSVKTYEIYPGILTKLRTVPGDFLARKRPQFEQRTQNSPPKLIHFPTTQMLHTMKNYGVSILPVGRLAKRGLNPNLDIEWTLTFPKIERYIQLHFNHPAMRCYLFILTLFKSHIEIENPQLGLNLYHIRNVLYWFFEKNWTDWADITLGAKMIEVLKELKASLSTGYLKDYFIIQKNLFESTPSKFLRISQDRIHKILERPFIYTLCALRNLKYLDSSFPVLDIKKLYSYVSATNQQILRILNPSLPISTHKEEKRRNSFDENKKDIWQRTKDKKQMKRMKQREKHERDKKSKKEVVETRKTSIDSINKEIPIRKDYYDSRQTSRTILIIELFSAHFLNMVQYFLDRKNFNQAELYLNHSRALLQLWNILTSGQAKQFSEEVNLKQKLQNLQDKFLREKDKYIAPPLPTRTSQISPKNSPTLDSNTAVNQNAMERKNRPPNLILPEHELENDEYQAQSSQNQIQSSQNQTQDSQNQAQDSQNLAPSSPNLPAGLPNGIQNDQTEVLPPIGPYVAEVVENGSNQVHSQNSILNSQENGSESIENNRTLSKFERINPNLDQTTSNKAPKLDFDLSEVKNVTLMHVEVQEKSVKVESSVEVTSKLLLNTIKSDNKKSILKNSVRNESSVKPKIEVRGVKFDDDSDFDDTTDL